MILFDLYIVIVGLLLGSFVYTLALRLESQETMIGRSHCDGCFSKLGILDLVPILGFCIQKGKCRSCGTEISLAYPIFETLNGILVYLIFTKTGWSSEFLHSLLIFEILYLIALIDFKTYLIFPQPIFLGLLVQTIWLIFRKEADSLSNIVGLCLGAGIFHWISYLYQNVRKKTGLGEGDATLLGLVGFSFGWEPLLPIIFWSSLLGIAGGGLILFLRKDSLKEQIAFGPWIVLASFFVWRFPDLFASFPL